MFYLSRTGTTEGPFTESVIVDMIKSRLAETGHVCAVGAQEWVPINAHPPFAKALEERKIRESAPPPPVAAPDEAATVMAPPRSVRPSAPPLPAAALAQSQPQSQRPPVPTAMAPTQPSPFTPQAGPASYAPQPAAPSYSPQPAGQSYPPQPNGASFSPTPGPASVSMPVGGYGPPPSGHYSQPPMPQQGHASQPSWGPAPNPSYGPAPGAYGRHPSGFSGAMSIPPAKKSNVGLIIAAVFGVLLVLGGGGAALAYFFLFKSAPLANNYPESTQVYAEVGNIKRSALGMASLMIVDPSKVDEKKALDDAQNAFVQAFDLSKEDAARVALGIQGISVGGRDFESKSSAAFTVMIAWDDAKAAEALLKSNRFSPEGDVGKSGKRYSIKRREQSGDAAKNAGMLERVLSDLRLSGTNKDDQLVWFPKKKLLVLANERGLNDTLEVVEGGQKALTDSKVFASQKAHFGGPGIAGFVDPAVIKGEKAKDIEKYFAGTRPILLSAVAERAGLRMTMSGEIAGLDEDVAKMDGYLTEPSIGLYKKLPKETVAYLAFSTKTKLSGKDARDAFFKSLNKEKSTAGLQKEVEDSEKALGADLTTVFDALGDEGAIAALARSGYRYQKDAKPSFDDFGVVYAQKIKDAAAAKKIVGSLKEKVKGGPFKITPKGDDLVVDADKPFPRVEIRFVDGSLVAVAGAKELADRTFAALGGAGTLGDDAAHTAAVSGLNAKHMLLWLDLGRIGDNALGAMPEIKESAKKTGVDLDSLILTGDKRVSGALGLTLSKQGNKLGYTIDSMNLPIVGGALAAVGPSLLLGKSKFGDDKIADKNDGKLDGFDAKSGAKAKDAPAELGKKSLAPATAGGGDLPAVCENALSRYDRCVYKSLPAASRSRVVKALRDGMSRQTGESRPRYCQALIDAAERSTPGCQ